MMGRNPFRIVSGSRRNSGIRIGRGISLRCSRRLLRGLAALSSLALLGEVRRNPEGVEKVHNTGEARKKEEVQEDAMNELVTA